MPCAHRRVQLVVLNWPLLGAGFPLFLDPLLLAWEHSCSCCCFWSVGRFVLDRWRVRLLDSLGLVCINVVQRYRCVFGGAQWGRHPLAPSISPGKTWEGWAGGAAAALLVGGILHHNFGAAGSGHWIVLASLVSVFGPLGDLLESLLKRRAGIKDSGQILPGHGGILDRFDSHIIAAPVALLYLIYS